MDLDYPPGLPNKRGSIAHICIAGLIVILLIVGMVMVCYEAGRWEAVIYVVTGFAVAVFTTVLLHVALRVCWLLEELHHIPGRYPDEISAFWKAYTFNRKSSCACIMAVIITLVRWVLFGNPYVYLWNMGPMAYIMPFLVAFVFSNLMGMEESTLHTSLQIEKMKNLDYGSGMAYNFFHGYLRLVLPESGAPGTKGIKKRIETFINHHRIEESAFPVKKLFILIPQNLYTPTDLTEVSVDSPHDTDYWMKAAASLEPQEFDRAGVKQRTYKNSVYKIKNKDVQHPKPIYVVAEGATPLKTFYEVIKMNAEMSRVFKDHQHDIVSAFYRTLRDIIRDSDDCRDVCEIIYYVDMHGGKRANVARVILERIQELTGRDFAQQRGN